MKIHIPENAIEIINKEVPLSVRKQFVPIIKKGYTFTREIINNELLFNWDIGRKHEGYLRAIAVQYFFKREIDNGNLPLGYTIETNVNKTHKYLLLHTQTAKITISQVKTPHVIARQAFFRDKLQEANQLRMVFSNEQVEKDIANNYYYLLLTYSSGGKFPEFINLGLPNAKNWIDRINLLREPNVVVKDENFAEEEVIAEENLVGFRKFQQEVVESGK